MTQPAAATVVLVAYGPCPTLVECVAHIHASVGVGLDVVVVDNGAEAAVMSELASLDHVRIVGPPTNRGFADGCNAGVDASSTAYVVLVNTDAFVEPNAIGNLIRVAGEPGVGIASASIRLDDSPEQMNSAGNPVHFSMLTWAGAFGEPASRHDRPGDVPSASGAAMALRRSVWDQLGGFDGQLFAYLEDTDLSLRAWQQGLAVRYVPEAVVRHRYEFARHERKLYLLERNRGYLILTHLSARSLALMAPILLLIEVMMFAQALSGGWARGKLRAWGWLLRNHRTIRGRRREVRGALRVPDRDWMRHLCGRIDPANVPHPPGMRLLNRIMAGYWRGVLPLLGAAD